MILNAAGKIAAKCWQDIPVHFPKTKLHEYVVMPDHIHGIVEIIKIVGAQNLEPPLENKFQQIIPQSIGSIIRGFKIGVTKWFRYENQGDQNMRVWQRNYYEHIIRNDAEYIRIANYILNNPAKWSRDSKS
jgi:REP element-mobilizing transposase RayT